MNTVIAQMTYTNRQALGNYVMLIPPGVTAVLLMDRANRAYVDNDERDDVMAYLQANLYGVRRIVETKDASAASEPGIPYLPVVPPVGNQGAAMGSAPFISGSVYRIRLVDPAAAIYAETGEMNAGVATLLAHYEEATGGDGGAMIHVPAQLAPYVLGGGSGGARIAWPEGNIYRGPLNSTVVLGPGYPLGESPDNSPLGHGPLMSQGPPQTYRGNPPDMAWIYVTGPVEYATGPIQLLPEVERDRIPFRTNYYQVWAERAAIVRFDPPTCFATLVTNPAPLGTFS